MGSFLLTRVRFSSLNRCAVLKQRDYLNELFENPHLADTLLTWALISFRHHEAPQFYKFQFASPLSWLETRAYLNVKTLFEISCFRNMNFPAWQWYQWTNPPADVGDFVRSQRKFMVDTVHANYQILQLWRDNLGPLIFWTNPKLTFVDFKIHQKQQIFNRNSTCSIVFTQFIFVLFKKLNSLPVSEDQT